MSKVLMKTNFGDITIELNNEKAPITAANFEQYVKDGFYDGVIFHRVIDGFMVQGGGFDEDMNQKSTRDNIENEADNGLSNDVGTLAMARTQDPHSASAQFFINVNNNSFLNHSGKNSQGWGYAVFGAVTEGMDVVNAMKNVATTMRSGHQDVPAENVVIESASMLED
ncbi:MAG TPA: peptidylprolyl isomerase [Oceanospirillaceae bacterium]|nr:peptidylprolyl isomerase [Oceanospirillaceae bacterium]